VLPQSSWQMRSSCCVCTYTRMYMCSVVESAMNQARHQNGMEDDFVSSSITAQNRQASALGSHDNTHLLMCIACRMRLNN
jgi:hypothetical protein